MVLGVEDDDESAEDNSIKAVPVADNKSTLVFTILNYPFKLS